MRILFIIAILIWNYSTIFSQINCEKYTDKYIPKHLNDALDYLDCFWTEKDKEDFKHKNEEEAVTEFHFGTGRAIRNDWGLWRKKKNSLKRYFKRFGIFHPDDISSIILTSFHRKLNDKDLNLEQQLNTYKAYWSKIEDIEKNAQKVFKEISIGDKVEIPFGISKSGNKDYMNVYSNVSNFTDFDCLIEGIILDKNRRKRGCNLRVQVTKLCNSNTLFYNNKKIIVGSTFFYNMKYFKISL